MIQATLKRIDKHTDSIWTFWFHSPKKVRYQAGQFTEISLPHTADNRGDNRWFSLSSSPSEPLLAITTKFSDKSSSFKQALQSLSIGATVNMAEPMGDFVLPKDPDIPLVFIAAGIGITPFRSMLKYLNDTEQPRSITLLYKAPEHELLFKEIIDTSKVAVRYPTGKLSFQTVKKSFTPDALQRLYLSGPEKMVEDLYSDLTAHGVEPSSIQTDYFHGYPAL